MKRLRIKDSVDIERLREFGFAPGSELITRNQGYAEIFDGCDYMLPWWHKFQCDDDGIPEVTYDGVPVCQAWVDTRDGENCIWFDVTPCGTYHASMDDLDIVTETVFALTKCGLITDEE